MADDGLKGQKFEPYSRPKRKRRQLNEKELQQLRYMSGIRLPMPQIAASFGISKDVLLVCIKKDAAARAALEEGRAAASYKVRGTLFQRAVGRDAVIVDGVEVSPAIPPDFFALKFWCETQEGFSAGAHKHEISGPDGAPLQLRGEDMNRIQREAAILRLIQLRQLTDESKNNGEGQ